MNGQLRNVAGAAGIAASCAIFASVAGCSTEEQTIPRDKVVEAVTAQAGAWAGQQPDSVTCPNDLKRAVGASTECELKVGGYTWSVPVSVGSIVGDKVNYDIVEGMRGQDVANQIADSMSQSSGHRPEVTCPGNLNAYVGTTLRCHVKDGDTRGVTVTVTKAAANEIRFNFEVDNHPEG